MNNSRFRTEQIAAALVVNLTLAVLLLAGWLVESRWPDVYYRLIPEDAPVEWATFWAEVLACTLNAWLAWTAAPRGFTATWYKAGIALFCFLVAGEEISWGQRLIGYAPSEYFLAHNIQLETNIHNLFVPTIWSAGIEIVIGAFGVVLPLLMLASKPAALARRFGLYAPPTSWVAGFAFVLAIYVVRPFYLCEEIVELDIGLGLAFAALWQLGQEGRLRPQASRPALLAIAAALSLALGSLTAAGTDHASSIDTALDTEASAELEALRQDFIAMRSDRGGQFVTECDLQARLHSLDRREVLLPLLHAGAFWKQTAAIAPKRAQYFLDPWNMPYWISDQCDSAARYIMLFSFGPNRRRESSEWMVGGDDLAVYAFHLGTPRQGDWRALAQVDQISGR